MTLFNDKLISKNKRYYTQDDTEFKFLLGGIGTGSVSMGSRGNLCDWEIFNNPNKDVVYPYSFFSIFSQFEGQKGEVRILEAQISKPYSRPRGYSAHELAGIPRFQRSIACGYGPFVDVELFDDNLPLEVKLTAFSPFIPTDEDNSGIPAISFKYTVTNKGKTPCQVSVCATQTNYTAHQGFDLFENMVLTNNQINTFFEQDNLRGIFMETDAPNNAKNFGTMCLATTNKQYTVKPNWLRGGWWDGAHDFFNEFSVDGKLSFQSKSATTGVNPLEYVLGIKTGSLSAHETILPNESKQFSFVLSWHFPNRPKSWQGHICPARDPKDEIIKNYYAYKFADAKATVNYFVENMPTLYKASSDFTNALFSTTVDSSVIDAINGTLAVLRSTTCFRVGEEGTFLCWEGCHPHQGSCEGNCTHVWNYAQAVAFLFPRLEQNMRRTEFLLETDETGHMAFRTMQVLGDKKWDMIPATDGQMGCVIRLYRDWKFSGDDQLLKDCYPKMKKALDFAFSYWDSNGDCVLDSQQHNTYDIEFYGESSLTNSIFFAALVAGSRMAEYVGDKQTAVRWQTAFERGSVLMDKKLYRNGYYVQVIDDVDKYKYQYGDGCLSDQIFGQTLAHINNLGYILPKDHVKSTAKKIFESNFKTRLTNHLNVQRVYALNDESGLLVCGWPKGTTRPRIPFIYADEVWTGIEYQVATELVYEGYVDEAMQIVKAVRSRHSGKNRNPFNEVECGNHYARSLASYGVLLALNGFKFDATKKVISFEPKVNVDDFSTFFTTANAFGIYHCKKQGTKTINDVTVLYGSMDDIIIK